MLFVLASLATAPLVPSGKWVVDYRKDMCVVWRPFGPNATFAIKPAIIMDSSAANLVVPVPKAGGDAARTGTAAVTLQPSGKTFAGPDTRAIILSVRWERSRR